MEKAHGVIWREVWFRKIGEDGISSLANRMTQQIFVGHHDRTGTVLRITKNGVVRGNGWTKQTQSDAWESTNWEGLSGTPWQIMAPELKLMKKVKADQEGAGPPLPRNVVERTPEVEPRRLYMFCPLKLGLTDTHWRLCRMCCACIAWKSDKTTKCRMPRTNQKYH